MADRLASPASAQPIAPVRRANIRDDVYAVLRNGILNHTYPPGHRLDLDELSQQMQVSRTPVKEALHRLEGEGLISILPRRGTFVSVIDAVNVAESYDVRLALEVFAAPAVIRNLTPDALAQLRALKTRMRALLGSPDFAAVVDDYIAVDQQFHDKIMRIAGNERAREFHSTIGGPLQLARILNRFSAAEYLRHTEPEHEAIFAAVAERSVTALQRAMTQHIELAKARVLTRIQAAGGKA